MKKTILKIARYLIPLLPKGKSLAINTTLFLAGNKFEDIVTLLDGQKFYIGKITSMNRRLFFLGDYYEKEETELFNKIIKEGDYVFDLGANFGWYTIVMSKLVGREGRVFSFEIDLETTDELRKTIETNNCKNVVLENLAIGDSNKNISIFYSKEQGIANLNRDLIAINKVEKVVSMVTLDSYIEKNKIPRVDFIKCDIDGSEQLFLRGAKNTLSSRPLLVIEADENMQTVSGFKIENLFQELMEIGYLLFSIERNFSQVFGKDPNGLCENIFCVPENRVNEFNFLNRSSEVIS